MKPTHRWGLAALMAAASAGPAAADGVQFRVAVVAAQGSSSMKLLVKGSAEISAKTQGRVELRYLARGVEAKENDIVRQLKLGQFDGAMLTSAGLELIDGSIRVLDLPRLFESIEELDYVADKMWPYFQDKFKAKGFVLADRGEVGPIHFLSATELRNVSVMKSANPWMRSDDGVVRTLYKALGLTGVPLGVEEVEPALTTGRVNMCYGAPYVAVGLGWHTKTKYLAAMEIGYVIAATVMKSEAYAKLTPDDAGLIGKITEAATKAVRSQVRKDNAEAKKEMERRGVTVAAPTPELLADLDKAALDVRSALTGKLFTKAELDQVLAHRAEFRAKQGPR